MLNNIKKKLYFTKADALLNEGIKKGKIVPFDDDFYNKLKGTIIYGLPVSMRIKYLRPSLSPGNCYDRSLYMFLCFDDAVLVRADLKDLELKYGKEDAGHGWIEIGNYVYDPTMLMRFDKDLYYKIYQPTNIDKTTKEDFYSQKDSKEFYEDIRNTTIEDLKPNGKKRIDLISTIPLIYNVALMSNNTEFISELNEFLSSIKYDEEEINKELNEKFKKAYIKRYKVNNK